MKPLFKTLLKTASLLAILVLVGLVLFPIFSRGINRSKSSCQSNLKQMSLGMFQYTQDWDEKFAPVNLKDTNINEKNPLGWADTLFPYLKSHQIFWCPEQLREGVRDHNEKLPSARDYTDYFYNRRLAGQSQAVVEAVYLTILYGEGNDGTDAANARYSLHELPRQWRTDKKSPSHRHIEGGNYAFADGHVKWMKPDAVTSLAAAKGLPTFSLQ